MSLSERRLIATAADDTEVFLIDAGLALQTRSVGTLDVSVAPGLYKVKFRRGALVREVPVAVLPGEGDVSVDTPDDFAAKRRAERPSPVTAAAAPQAIEMSVAGLSPARARRKASRAGQLTVIVSAAGQRAELQADDRLTLLAPGGDVIADLTGLERADPGARLDECWDLPAGGYRLRTVGARGTLEQSVVVSRGWTTRVRLRMRGVSQEPAPRDTPAGEDPAGALRADLADATISMGRTNQTSAPVDDVMASIPVLAKTWLAQTQVTIATAFARKMLQGPIDDPLCALCVVLALVRGSELEKGQGRPVPTDRMTLIRELAGRLESPLEGHPDHEILGMWIRRRPVAIEIPPMLSVSWGLLTLASISWSKVLAPTSLAGRIGEHVVTTPVWLSWRADLVPQDVPVRRRPTAASLVLQRLAAKPFSDSRELGLSDLEMTIAKTLPSLPPAPAPKSADLGLELKKVLGLPAPIVDRALASLVKKMR